MLRIRSADEGVCRSINEGVCRSINEGVCRSIGVEVTDATCYISLEEEA